MLRLTVLLALGALATSCTSPVRTAPSPIEEAAKSYRPTPGKTTVYVFRDATQWATGMKDGELMSLELDGEPLGVTLARTFLVAVVTPGEHELTSIADNRSSLRIVGKPGEVLYVYQDAKYLVSRSTRLELVEPAAAQRRIESCRLVASAPPPAQPPPPPPPANFYTPPPAAPTPPPAAPPTPAPATPAPPAPTTPAPPAPAAPPPPAPATPPPSGS
jgi:hypothetical protein